MEVTASPERRWLLLDKSALVRGPEIDETLGEPCLCAITRLEMLYSARSDGAYQELQAELDAVHNLRVDAETIDTAVTAQRELAAQSQHRAAERKAARMHAAIIDVTFKDDVSAAQAD